MRRRTLLVTTGTLLSAGCSGLPGGDGTDTDTTTGTGTTAGTTPAPGTESPPPGTETLSEPPTTNATDTAATDTETDTPEDTPTPTRAERQAARKIDEARSHLSTALSEYVAFGEGENPTLLSIDATVNVTVADVTNPVSAARKSLDEVPDGANADQQSTVEALRGVATFLDRGVRCQAKLYDAYKKFDFVVGRLYAERTGGVPDEIADIRAAASDARGYLDTLTAQTSADDTAAFDGIDEATYTDKVAQFQAEVDAFPTLADALSTFRKALETFVDAAESYLDGSYRDPREQFPEAADDFRTAAGTLSDLDAPDSVADTVADLVSVAEALAPASDDLAAASRAGFTGDSGTREDRFEAAKDDLRTSQVAVEKFDTVQDLLDE